MKKILRLILLILVGAAALNGVMVFLFFDGTNFYKESIVEIIENRKKWDEEIFKNKISDLEKKVVELKSQTGQNYSAQVKEVEDRFVEMDSIIKNSTVIFNHPSPRKNVRAEAKKVTPFKVEAGKLSICIERDCFYKEGLPRYFPVERVGKKKSATERMNQFRNKERLEPLFLLEEKSGPFELWIMYWIVDDSTVQYCSNYLIHNETKKLLRKNVNLNDEGAYMEKASTSGKYLIIGYGCCPGVHGFSLIDEDGLEPFKEREYLGNLNWIGDTLVFWDPGKPNYKSEPPFKKHKISLYTAHKTKFINGEFIHTGETMGYDDEMQ